MSMAPLPDAEAVSAAFSVSLMRAESSNYIQNFTTEARSHGVAKPQPKPNIHHGGTETRSHTEKNRGKHKVKSKNKVKTREQPRTQRKFRGEWKSMEIFAKKQDSHR